MKVIARGYRNWNFKYISLRVRSVEDSYDIDLTGIRKITVVDGAYLLHGDRLSTIISIPTSIALHITRK